MPGEFFQIPENAQLPETARTGQIEEHETSLWALGGEPSSEDNSDIALSEATHPESSEHETISNDLDWPIGTGPLWTEQEEESDDSKSSEEMRESDARIPSCIETWRYSVPNQQIPSEDGEQRENECPEPEVGFRTAEPSNKQIPSEDEEQREDECPEPEVEFITAETNSQQIPAEDEEHE